MSKKWSLGIAALALALAAGCASPNTSGITVGAETDADGNLQTALTGMDVLWTSMVTPNGRRISHLECNVAAIQVAKGPRITGLHLELLEADGQRFLVALDAADWGGVAPPQDPGAEARALRDAMDSPAP